MSVLKPQRECSQYEPHAWIYDRCRDCGGSEASHSGAAGDDSAPEAMRRGSAMVVRHSAVSQNQKRNSLDGSSGKQNLDIHGLQFLEIGDVGGHPQQRSEGGMAQAPAPALSPVQMQAQSADDQMSEVVAKANFLESEFQRMQAGDKQRLESNQITQEEYDRNIAELQAAYAQKEAEVRQEAETARRALEEANQRHQREIEENAARAIAEAQDHARMKVEEAQLATRQILEEAEREKAEALAYKREAEDARALAQAEAELQKRLAAEAHAQALQSRSEADQARGQVQQLHEAAEVVVAAEMGDAAMALDSDEYQPAAPMSSTAVSHEPEAHLSDVLKNVERLFQQGCNVVRYTAHRPATMSAIFIRKSALHTDGHHSAAPVAAQGAIGSGDSSVMAPSSYSLCWSKADDRSMHPTRSLDFRDIAAVVLGKQSTVLRTQAPAAPDRRCVSFIAGANCPTKSLHVQFGSARDADTWAYGVASLMKELGAKPSVFEDGQYFEQEVERKKDLEAADRELDDGARPALQADIDALDSSAGSAARYQIELACKCSNLPSLHKNTIVCLVDRDEHTNKLRYLNQTDRVADTNSPAFRKRFPLVYVDSATAKTLRLNVYDVPGHATTIDDEFRLGSAVVSIKAMVDRPEAEFVYTLSHRQPQKQAALAAAMSTITVSCVSKKMMAADAMAAHSGIPLLGEEERRLREELRATERMLAHGDVFHNYVEHAPVQNITMLYIPGTDGSAPALASAPHSAASAPGHSHTNPFDRFELGSLQWSVVGAKAQLMPLRSVVDVFVGKKSPSFPADTADDRAFSLVSKGGVRLDLEAKSRQQRDSWVQGIISLLKAAAAQQQKDKAAAAARAAAQDLHALSTSASAPSAVQTHNAHGAAPQLHHAQTEQQHVQMAPAVTHAQY